MQGLAIAVVVGLVLAVEGCGPSTTIVSTRSLESTEKLSSVFVLSQVEVSADRFEKELVQTAAACGVRVGVAHMSRLDLDPAIHLERMKEFDPRHVLLLKQAGGITGADHWDYYDAHLFEMPKKPVWRADVRLHRDGTLFGDPGATLAMDLLRKLRDDRFIPPCSKLVDPYERPQPRAAARH